MGERTRGRDNNVRTLVFAEWDTPWALSPRRRCHFRPLIAPLLKGDARAIAIGRSRGVLSPEVWFLFARGRALIAGLYWGKHARIPLGASKANPRLNFGYILASSRFRRLIAVRQESCSRLGAVVISDPWSSCVSPEERFMTRACHQMSVSPKERFIPERCTFSKSVTPARCTPGAFHHRAFHPRGGLPQGRFSPELFTP